MPEGGEIRKSAFRNSLHSFAFAFTNSFALPDPPLNEFAQTIIFLWKFTLTSSPSAVNLLLFPSEFPFT